MEPKPGENKPDRGTLIGCNKCDTRWWTAEAGDTCPVCDNNRYEKLKKLIEFHVDDNYRQINQCQSRIDVLTKIQGSFSHINAQK